MTIKQCDHCQKTINREEIVDIMPTMLWENVELCSDCAKPIFKLLKKYEILKDSGFGNLLKKSRAV
jgi:hypothetical protein